MSTYLLVQDVANKLKKKEQFVRNELRRGKLRGSYFGGAWHITEADLATYVEAHMNVRPVEKRRRSA